MKTHELKVHKSYVKLLLSGRKTFEVRKNDRDFQEGDVLILRPWDEKKEEYIGGNTEFYYNVTYVLHGGKFGIEEGYCVMGIVPSQALNRSFFHEHSFKIDMEEISNFEKEMRKLRLL
ncbi:MAG: DUF3850 domain-containing protein [Bacteroidetes bacterium]|nr:DUF3850 domain-containing protein [Bacteroidota bacterium]